MNDLAESGSPCSSFNRSNKREKIMASKTKEINKIGAVGDEPL